ncbi:MAG: glycosyltransferase family 2 protein [Verrucomicrobiae bacterium]|nr:glycosyltransferase family 2 protein [Verrucomicrobiae bacterium]
MKISCCLITLNEERNLPRCLRSLQGVADEIVILDSSSTDRTPQIAAEFGARYLTAPWQGFVAQKNLAVQHAAHPWVLALDADEELSGGLRRELADLKKGPDPHPEEGFLLNRCTFYEGRWIRHGDWYPDRILRLFHRDHGRYVGGRVHERVEVPGRTTLLANDLLHYSFQDRSDHMARIRKYAQLWAETKSEQGKCVSALTPYSHAVARFLVGYVWKKGFLDGAQGLAVARMNAYDVFSKYRLLHRLLTGKRP